MNADTYPKTAKEVRELSFVLGVPQNMCSAGKQPALHYTYKIKYKKPAISSFARTI